MAFNYDSLLVKQRENFDFLDNPLVDLEDQVWHELCVIQGYYYQREADGELFTSNQRYVIDSAIDEILGLMALGKVNEAAMTVVALMVVMGLSVKLVAVKAYMSVNGIGVEDLVDVDTFNNNLDNGKGKRL